MSTHTQRVVELQNHRAQGAREFVRTCKYYMLGHSTDAAAQLARADGPSVGPRIIALLEGTTELSLKFLRHQQKALADPGTTTGWGSPLAIFESQIGAYLSSLSGISAFDALWPAMLQAPLHTKVSVSSGTLTNVGGVAEASAKPLSQSSLSASDLVETKCTGIVAVAAELLKAAPNANNILETALRKAIVRATSNVFLPLLVPGATFASSGVTAIAVRQDLRTLLANVNSGADSKLYWILTRKITEALAVLPDSTGAAAFPTVSVNGGTLAGAPIVVCDEATDGEIILVDASQVAAGRDTEDFRLDTSNYATINMAAPADSPTAGSTVLQSLWQTNEVGVKVERWLGAKLLRSDACAKVTGVSYSGNSPA